MGAVPSYDVRKAGQHVVDCTRTEGEVLGDLYVKATTRRHGKVSLGSSYFSRYFHAGPREKRIMGGDHGQLRCIATRYYGKFLAERSVCCAEQDLKIGTPARRSFV